MSKSGQQSPASVNLGNQTYDRGVADGIHGRPKSIKKTHAHAHRYHIGYRQGEKARARSGYAAVHMPTADGVQTAFHGESAKILKKGLLSRFFAWIRA